MTKFNWKQRIQKEYNQPVKKVIMAFLEKRFSRAKTAAALGIHYDTLRNYLIKENIQWCHRKELNELCKGRPFENNNNPYGCKGRGK